MFEGKDFGGTWGRRRGCAPHCLSFKTCSVAEFPADLVFCALALSESQSAGCQTSVDPGTLNPVQGVLQTLSGHALLTQAVCPGPGAHRHVSSLPASPSPCPPLERSLSCLPSHCVSSSGSWCLCLSLSPPSRPILPPYPIPPCVADSAWSLRGTLGVQPCCK